jgi:predicted dehydrogenase
MDVTKLGFIGTGTISPAYLSVLKKYPAVTVSALADIDVDVARKRADEFDIPRACTVDQLLADDDISLVINLTIPKVHAEVTLQVLESGKHVYSEKPLATNTADGRKVIDTARERGLRVGCAPDTFLGGGIQSARKILDDGGVGEILTGFASFHSCGPEIWHPNPDFYYQVGAGPMFDMGPYYLTALVNLLGPIKRVSGAAISPRPTRKIYSQPFYGTDIEVNVPTTASALLEFASGQVVTFLATWDCWAGNLPRIELYGSAGTLVVPDPNTFGGPVKAWSIDTTRDPSMADLQQPWTEPELSHGMTEQGRGIGVVDMAYAIQSGRPHRANGDMAFHVLEVMEAVVESSLEGRRIDIQSTCERPSAVPAGLAPGEFDA